MSGKIKYINQILFILIGTIYTNIKGVVKLTKL